MAGLGTQGSGGLGPKRSVPVAPAFAAVLLTAAYCLSFVDRQILALCIGPIRADIDATDAQMGVLGGFAFAVTYSLSAIPFGALVDRYSRWTIVAFGLLLWSAATCFSGLAISYVQLFIGRAGVGIGEAAIVPAAASLLASYYRRTELPRIMAVFMAAPIIGVSIANLGGGVLLGVLEGSVALSIPGLPALVPWRTLFLVAGLPGVIAAIFIWRIADPPRTHSPKNQFASQPPIIEKTEALEGFFAFISRYRRLVLCHVMAFVSSATIYFAFLYWVVEFLVRTYGTTRPVAGGTFGIILMVCGLLGCMLPGPIVAHLLRRGVHDATNRVCLTSAIVALPIAVAVPLAPDYTVAISLLAVLIFVISLPLSFGVSTMQLISPPHLQGRVVSVYLTFTNLLSFSLGPLSVGFVNDRFHGGLLLGRSLAEVAAFCYVAAALFMWGTLSPLRKRLKEIEQSEGARSSSGGNPSVSIDPA